MHSSDNGTFFTGNSLGEAELFGLLRRGFTVGQIVWAEGFQLFLSVNSMMCMCGVH